MTFCLRDEHGSKTEQISDGLTATGSDTPFMPVLRNNSSFFWESEHLTPEITGAAWLEKDRQYADFDLVTGKALSPIPDGTQSCINSIEHGSSYMSLPNGKYQKLPNNMFFEHITLENYPYDTVRLGWISTNKTTPDTLIEITIK